jgi:hypothetical protein
MYGEVSSGPGTIEEHTTPPAYKGNETVVHNAADCNLKIVALQEIRECKRLKKDPSESVERSTFILLKRFSLLRSLSTSSTSGFEASEDSRAIVFLQARGPLEDHCDHHFG